MSLTQGIIPWHVPIKPSSLISPGKPPPYRAAVRRMCQNEQARRRGGAALPRRVSFGQLLLRLPRSPVCALC